METSTHLSSKITLKITEQHFESIKLETKSEQRAIDKIATVRVGIVEKADVGTQQKGTSNEIVTYQLYFSQHQVQLTHLRKCENYSVLHDHHLRKTGKDQGTRVNLDPHAD